MKLSIASNIFPLFQPAGLDDVKDPCPVFDGTTWHLYGSGGTVVTETWAVYHATAPALEGPWVQQPLIHLPVEGSGVAAPGVIFDDGMMHMFIQTEFMRLGGRCEHLTSRDGFDWTWRATAFAAVPGTGEEGIYDPHPAVVGGRKYLVYSGMPLTAGAPQPDVYLTESESGTWFGPWRRLGKILDHDDIAHHNTRADPDYEWGLEGAQLVELADGRVMLNATCFLPSGERGSRQRVFFAIAPRVTGPFCSLGPVLDPAEPGENGHSTVMVSGNELTLFYQSRLRATGNLWRYGVIRATLEPLEPLEQAEVPGATQVAA